MMACTCGKTPTYVLFYIFCFHCYVDNGAVLVFIFSSPIMKKYLWRHSSSGWLWLWQPTWRSPHFLVDKIVSELLNASLYLNFLSSLPQRDFDLLLRLGRSKTTGSGRSHRWQLLSTHRKHSNCLQIMMVKCASLDQERLNNLANLANIWHRCLWIRTCSHCLVVSAGQRPRNWAGWYCAGQSK